MDGEYLFRLARQKSAESRSVLAATISDLFSEDKGALSERERAMMFDILHKIIHDVEMTVRRRLSEKMADYRDVPRHLISILANDTIEVAYPILSRSLVLQDRDLIEIIQQRTREHQMAIATRPSVSEAVSNALVETGEASVIRTLLNNPNAEISRTTMDYLVEESKRVDSFQEPILRRADLPMDLATRMFMWVSAALRQHILDNFELPEELVDDLLEQTAVAEASALANAQPTGRRKSVALAEKLEAAGMITPDMLITALQQGETSLFIAMFRRVTGLREKLIMRILFESGGEGLAIACKAVGIGKAAFTSLFALSRKARPEATAALQRETRRVLMLFDQISESSARDVLRKWQRNVDYLTAVRELELGV